ncbi:MAG: protein kinase, partial [Candidatus Eremiobacterota bacterium]
MEEKTWHLSDGEDHTFIDEREKSTELSYIYSRINSEKLCIEEAKITEDWNRGDIILDLYEVKEILGEGAFGRVYRVYHRGWNRYLAVKTLHSHLVSDEEHKKSFIKECQGWVNLGLHPNIVSCYYVRDLGGLPRIFLEYIDGGTLASVKKDKGLKEILDYSIQCLDGLIFAHNKGLIHRDIKPLNCLLTSGGDLKITDFGIASGLAGFDSREKTGIENPAGTPAYMPPEQWSRGTSGPWSDIYSFGVMLYEMCCLKRPFDEGNEPVYVLKARHLTMEPEHPRNINKNIPENLSAFILKCLAKKPEERYKNCEDARAELAGIYEFITGKPYDRKKAQEGRLMADGLNNRAVSMIDLGKKQEAENILNEALKIEPSHGQSLYNRGILMWRSGRITDVELIKQMEEAGNSNFGDHIIHLISLIQMERGNSSQAVTLLKKVLPAAGEADRKEIEKDLHKALEQGENATQVKLIKGHTWVNSVCISSDEKTGLSGSQDGTLNLWNLSDGTCIKTIKGHTNFVTSVSMSSDGTKGLSGSRDRTVRLWDLKSGNCIRTFQGHKGPVNSVNISSDGTLAISGGTDKIIYIWDIKSGNLIKELDGHSDSIESVCISPDGTYVLSGSKDRTVRLWDPASGKTVRTMEGHINCVNTVCISYDGNFALSGSGSETGTKDNTIRLWDLKNGQCINIFRGHGNFITSLSMSRDGRFILSGSEDRTVRIWFRETGQCIRTIDMSTGISSVSISPSGKFALTGSRKFSTMSSEDTPLHLWNLEQGNQGAFIIVQPRSSLKAIEDSVKFDEFLKEGEELLKKGSYREVIQVTDRARNLPGYDRAKPALDLKYKASVKGIRQELNSAWFLRSFEGHKNKVTSMTGNDRFILSGSQDKAIIMWDREEGQIVKTFEGHSRAVSSLCLSSDGAFALSGSEDNTLRMWFIESGICLNVFEGHKSGVTSVCISPSGDYALSGSWDKTICLWERGREKCLKIFTGHTESVTCLCISSDGEFFLSGSTDKTIRLWNIRKGTVVKILKGHNDSVTSMSVSRDDRYVLTGSRDGTMYLWDLEKGCAVKTFKEHRGAVTSVSFLRDGRFCISAGEDGKLLIWNLEKGKTVKILEGHTSAVSSVFITSEGRFVLSAGEETIRSYELDWNYEFPDKQIPDEGIRPYIKTFLHNNEEDVQKLLVTLGQCGYGWVSEVEVRKEVERLKSTFKRQIPLIEYVTKPVLSKSDIEKFDSLVETKTNKFFDMLKGSLKNKHILFICSAIIAVMIFILLKDLLFPGNRTDRLIENLTSADKERQNSAVKSLIKAGDSAVEPLIKALKDEDPARREMAAKALGEIGNTGAIEPLIVLL